jgi:Fe-S-cluster containining protein
MIFKKWEHEKLLYASKEDIERIKGLGFDYDYFVVNRGSWLQLRNYDGRCVFNDGKRCLIYKNRPEGCRLYPIIYDEDKKCAALDEDCPHRDEFKISERDSRIEASLVTKLKDERRQRK